MKYSLFVQQLELAGRNGRWTWAVCRVAAVDSEASKQWRVIVEDMQENRPWRNRWWFLIICKPTLILSVVSDASLCHLLCIMPNQSGIFCCWCCFCCFCHCCCCCCPFCCCCCPFCFYWHNLCWCCLCAVRFWLSEQILLLKYLELSLYHCWLPSFQRMNHTNQTKNI